MRFKGRVILLTGATRGIGAEILEQLVSQGATVLAVARDDTTLKTLEARHPSQVHTLAADLADPDMARAIARWVRAEHPTCSVLINNAAVMTHTRYLPFDPAHAKAIDHEITINLSAPIRLCVAMLPVLDQAQGAAICNVTSGLAIAPRTNAATYCATKAGLRSFTRALRYQIEDAVQNIVVSEAIMTLVDTSLSEGDPEKKLSPAKAAAEVLAGIRDGKREIWVERTKLLRIVNRLSPALAARILRGPRVA